MHRRSVLLRCLTGAGAAGLVLAGGPARAQSFPKSTKAEAGYVDRAQPEIQYCAVCVYFMTPDDCSIVEGPVSPLGSCDYFDD